MTHDGTQNSPSARSASPGDTDSGEGNDLFADPEPWHPIERKLVGWSLAAAFASLAIFGILAHLYIL